MIVAEGVQFPKTVSQLRKVPGIGDYTAGAIASIAFKEVSNFSARFESDPKTNFFDFSLIKKAHVLRVFFQVVPVVDGNVIRVIARLRAISANPKDSLTVKKFW